MINKIEDIKEGSIISESSHYIVESIDSRNAKVKHFESGTSVYIGIPYLREFTNSADTYSKVIKVTKEDKKDGTLGIRSIFEGIHNGQVFTVTFKKQDKAKTKKEYAAQKEAQILTAIELIDKAKRQKKSMAGAYEEALRFIQDNPIKDFTEGEERTLRGFKIQFTSRDGKYKCIDMDIPVTEKETGERLVNINTISSLIYDGIKYEVE